MNFIAENWQFILVAALTLVSGLLVIFKKPTKVVNNPLILTLELLPTIIKDAESLFGAGNGEKKLDWVINMASSYYISLDGVSTDSVFIFLKNYVEAILETPQKKG